MLARSKPLGAHVHKLALPQMLLEGDCPQFPKTKLDLRRSSWEAGHEHLELVRT